MLDDHFSKLWFYWLHDFREAWEPIHRCRSSRFHQVSQTRFIFTQWVWNIRHRGWLISLSEISEIAVWNGEPDKIYMLINFTMNIDRPRLQGVLVLRPEKSARPRCVQTQLCQPTLLAWGFPQRRVYARSVLQVRQSSTTDPSLLSSPKSSPASTSWWWRWGRTCSFIYENFGDRYLRLSITKRSIKSEISDSFMFTKIFYQKR